MPDCVFCRIVADVPAGDDPDLASELAELVYADDRTVAFLDRAPVFKGHVLVVPRPHIGTLADLPGTSIEAFFGVVQRVAAVLPDALDAHGTFVAINNVVSQSVPHLHVHVVPRRRKDGLRGFFWPRVRYADDAEASAIAARIRSSLAL